jgi:hypothetical protein
MLLIAISVPLLGRAKILFLQSLFYFFCKLPRKFSRLAVCQILLNEFSPDGVSFFLFFNPIFSAVKEYIRQNEGFGFGLQKKLA